MDREPGVPGNRAPIHDMTTVFAWARFEFDSFVWTKPQRQGLLCTIARVETQGAGPGTPDHGHCASNNRVQPQFMYHLLIEFLGQGASC
jgi:hypothetical protein